MLKEEKEAQQGAPHEEGVEEGTVGRRKSSAGGSCDGWGKLSVCVFFRV